MMMKHSLFINFIVVTLLATLLAVECGRVSPVYALADPNPEVWLSPIYDTTIYQFSDYVDSLSDPQFEIFKIAFGAYIAAQAGSNDYDLVDPFTTKDGVVGWFKSLGLTAYNSLIDLVPDTYYDPLNGTQQSTAQLKELTKFAVAHAMGAAVLAANYSTEQDFLADLDNSDNMFFKFGKNLQTSINALVAINGGFYDWQMNPSPWQSPSFYFPHIDLESTQLAYYNELYSQYIVTPATLWGTIRGNGYFAGSNFVSSGIGKYDLFINTSDNTVKFRGYDFTTDILYFYYYGQTSFHEEQTVHFRTLTFDPSNFNSYQQIASYYLDFYPTTGNQSTNTLIYVTTNNSGKFYPKYSDIVSRVMVGSTWETAVPVENLDDLDFDLNNIQYYDQVQTDYLFDIRQFILDLINNTDLYTPWIDNLYDLDGVIVHDPDLIRVTTSIYDLLNTQNPVLPVNLNDLAEITTNNYVEEVKRASEGVASAIGEYVAFWHNADYVTVYVLLGCSLLVLVAALVGKMGK